MKDLVRILYKTFVRPVGRAFDIVGCMNFFDKSKNGIRVYKGPYENARGIKSFFPNGSLYKLIRFKPESTLIMDYKENVFSTITKNANVHRYDVYYYRNLNNPESIYKHKRTTVTTEGAKPLVNVTYLPI